MYKTPITENSKRKVTISVKIQNLLNKINYIYILLVGVCSTLLAYMLNFKDAGLNLLMLGFLVLSAEALMSHFPYNPITEGLSHRRKSRCHGILQIVGGLMVLLGISYKEQSAEVDFTTWYGRFAITTIFMCFASILGGLFNYIQPKFIHKIYSPSKVKYRYNLFGMLTFYLVLAIIILYLLL